MRFFMRVLDAQSKYGERIMGKYPGTYTTKDVCKAEVRECKAILKKYHVSAEDREIIISMIQQPYHMLSDSYQMSNAIEAYIKDELSEEALNDFFSKYVTHRKEAGTFLAGFIKKQTDEYIKEQRKLDAFKRIK